MSPDLEEPVRAIQLALSDAGLRPEDMGYVNLHGTATPLNDRVEITVMQRVFGDKVAKVPMSSTKSLIGHPQGACGAAGMAATWLGLAQGFLPPTLNLDETDPGCELDLIPHQARVTPAETALCNCMGFGSKNSALVISKAGFLNRAGLAGES